MTESVIIVGAGGNCIDILDTIEEINAVTQEKVYECLGFLDDDEALWGQSYYGIEVLGSLETAINYRGSFFVNGIGSPSNFWKKRDLFQRLGIPLEQYVTIIHPSATISRKSTIGLGSVIFQNVTIASGVKIGNHVMILPNSVVSHDVAISDYTIVAGAACISGNVQIGHSSYIGTNSTIGEGINIGNSCLIGMGSVVTKEVRNNTVVVGNPARYFRDTA